MFVALALPTHAAAAEPASSGAVAERIEPGGPGRPMYRRISPLTPSSGPGTRGQAQLVALSPDARHVIATVSDERYIQVAQPDLVTLAVGQVVEAVRDPASWG